MRQHRLILSFLFSLAPMALAGCPASSDEVEPPPDEFYFPTGLALSPDQSDLFVVNANSDLRFDSGVLNVVNVGRVLAAVEAWDSGETMFESCSPDLGFPLTLICNEADFIDIDRGVRIGNFATEVELQETSQGNRLFVSVRGDPSLTYINTGGAGEKLRCGGDDDFHECGEEFRLTSIRNDGDLPSLPDEPFGVYVDSANGYVLTTHLSNGAVTLADAPADGSTPVLSDAIAGLFSNPNGLPGAVGIAGRLPGSEADRIYVTSRTDSRVQVLLVTSIPGRPKQITPGEFFFLDSVLPSSDSRDIKFSPDGNQAYIVNRNPPSLQIVDTSMGPTGVPRNEVDGVVELCRQASNVEVSDPGFGQRLYVACFRDGEVWIVDPDGREVEAIISVGRGPQFLASAESIGLLFVSNFRENTIAVIDIRPGSPTENRVVLRIGRPGETEGVD